MDIIYNIFTKYGISYPFDSIILSLCIIICIFILLPLFGKLIDLIEKLEYRILSNIMSISMASIVINRLKFPGVITHELSHALFAFISGAKIISIHVFSVFKGDTLGYVEYLPQGGIIRRSLQVFFTSFAPVPINIGLCVLMGYLALLFNTWYMYLILGYFFISFLNHASMSSVDLKLYFKGGLIAIPILTIILTCILILMHRV